MRHFWLSCAALAALLAGGGAAVANEKGPMSFGALDGVSPEAARARAHAWLKEVGKADPATTQRFEEVWKQADRSVLDRLTDTLALGDATAAKLLAEARDTLVPAPTQVPDVFKNDKLPAYFRANLALAYARALNGRRVHDEALAVLKLFNPEQVVDPAAFLFHRAVSEHALLQKAEATRSIRRLLEETGAIAPERYKTVALLMQLDMAAWKDKDLADIARKMKDVERRLDLARGGPKTQDKQKEILARLDEMIKKLENQAKKGGS